MHPQLHALFTGIGGYSLQIEIRIGFEVVELLVSAPVLPSFVPASNKVYKAFKVGANLNYRNLNRDLVKANTVTVGPELAYYALKGRKFSLLGIAAGTIGYQKAKAKSDLVYLEKSKAFVYGYEVGIRPEMLLSPKVALFAEYRFEMLFNSILRNNNHVGLGCVIYL